MKTYTKVRGHKPFNWSVFLSKKTHTDSEWNRAEMLAGSWVTCACGNQCSVLPREDDGEPTDEKLVQLGYDFHRAIEAEDVKGAKRVLTKIEKRSTQIINQMLKQSQKIIRDLSEAKAELR